MNKNNSKILLLTCLILVLSADMVVAQKYTTNPTRHRKSNTPYTERHDNSKKCMVADLSEIKKFDGKARNKVKQYLKFFKDNEKEKSKSFDKELERFREYFKSDKYNDMRQIYKKCDKEIPWPWIPSPFWLPNDSIKRISAI